MSAVWAMAVDQGLAMVIVGVITTVGGIITAILLNVRKSIGQINRAVNNVPDGVPTLVNRVGALERRTDEHTRWMTDCMLAIGQQLGVKLPERRDYDEAA